MSTPIRYSTSVLSKYFSYSLPIITLEKLNKLSTQRLYNVFKLVRLKRICYFEYDHCSIEELDGEDQIIASNLVGYEESIKQILSETREHLSNEKQPKAQYIKPSKRKSFERKKKASKEKQKTWPLW